MGKSPGKWIKTILLGKKSSRSNSSKGRHASKPTNEKETWIAAKEPTADLPVDPPSVSEPTPTIADRNEGNSVVEKGITSEMPCDEGGILPENRDVDKQETLLPGACNDSERIKLEQAATKAQAAFRGYLARRAFWVLRGIIRLQALVRGHLVRRQAVATLHCIQGIIKFQALIQVRRVKHSDAVIEGHKKISIRKPLDAKGSGSFEDIASTQFLKLSTNAFICKLLKSSPTGMPLRLQYSLEEPNSALIWLERWTSSRFWEPLYRPKKIVDPRSQSRQSTLQNAETKPGRSKRTVRRAPAAPVDNGLIHSTLESEKPRRNIRKITGHPVDPVLEHPQNELEKVKRNLRKVSSSTIESTDRLEVESEKPKMKPSVETENLKFSVETEKMKPGVVTENPKLSVEIEKPKFIVENTPDSTASDVPKNGTCDTAEKLKEDVALAVSEEPDSETTMEILVPTEPIFVLYNDDHPPSELPPPENIGQDNGNIMTDEELISKDDKSSHDSQKTSKRRASFPAKQETPENGLQNSPKLPSYMAATESAKAKLRAQGSPRSAQDGTEKNGFTRRHSLPSSTSAKLSSLSPRTQRSVQSNGKGGMKNEKSLLSSKDGTDKVIQAEWRR